MPYLFSMNPDEKQRLRQRMKGILHGMSPADRVTASAKIRSHLETWSVWVQAEKACVFHPMPVEPGFLHPWPEGKILIFPRVVGECLSLHLVLRSEDLVEGRFGVKEPAEETPQVCESLDLILVPGVAFDRAGMRLGRGGGYYDRLLQSYTGIKAGICFEEQVVEAVPGEDHDVAVDYLITPSGILTCER
jgi:5-formyltetrahydrofolate cyclo-ligase